MVVRLTTYVYLYILYIKSWCLNVKKYYIIYLLMVNMNTSIRIFSSQTTPIIWSVLLLFHKNLKIYNGYKSEYN